MINHRSTNYAMLIMRSGKANSATMSFLTPADAGRHLGHNFWNGKDREISIRHLADSYVPNNGEEKQPVLQHSMAVPVEQ